MISSDHTESPTDVGPRPGWLSRVSRWSMVAGLAALLLPLGTAGYVGGFARYLADDFCTLGSLRDLGFLGSQAYWYMHWSGRFAFTFTINLVEALGAWLVPVLPLAHLIALTAGVGLAFDRWLGGRRALLLRLTPWLISLVVVFGTVAGAPNLYQSLYWQTGGLTYITPLVLASFIAAWMVSRRAGRPLGPGSLVILGLAMAVAVGYSETVGSLLVAGLAGTLVMLLILPQRGPIRSTALGLVAAALMGGIVGMVIMAAAPGNAIRQGLLTPSSGVAVWLTETARSAYIFSVRTLKADPLRLALGLVVPFLATAIGVRSAVGSKWGRGAALRQLAFLILLPPFTFALVMACMAPTQYAMSSYPDGRILISAQFVVAAGTAVWGAAAGRWLLHVWPPLGKTKLQGALVAVWLVALVGLGATGVQSARVELAPLADARDFAARSDERLAKVLAARQQGVTSLPVASLTHMGGLDEISTDATYWVNVCFAQAYGLKRVSAK